MGSSEARIASKSTVAADLAAATSAMAGAHSAAAAARVMVIMR